MKLPIVGEYPPEWPAVSYAVKVAAGWRCTAAGTLDPLRGRVALGMSVLASPGEEGNCDEKCTHERTGPKQRSLTVHHLDGDKANLRWWNLLALCQVCHLKVQARVIPERPWLWEHTEWFRPYVAGFYAKYYAGLELGRDEAVSRMDELLALGQPWRPVPLPEQVEKYLGERAVDARNRRLGELYD